MILKLKRLSNIIRKTQKSDRDFICVITGATGEGKSTVSTHLHILSNPKFDFWDNIVYTRAETIDKVKNLPDGSSLGIDEGMNIFFRRDFQDKQQKELLKLFDMCRDRHLFMTICLPWLWALDNHILQSGRIKLWIHVDKRGRAYAFMPDRNPFTSDAWHRKENEKKLLRWSDGIHPEKSPNYVGDIFFEDLPDDIKKKYIEVKTQKKINAEQYVDPKEQRKIKMMQDNDVKSIEASILSKLKDKGLLVRGAITSYANMEGNNKAALYKRLQRSE